MRQLMYVSTSHIGHDFFELEHLTIQAGVNNALHDVTGLLWTDGQSFGQLLEGSGGELRVLLELLRADTRHSGLQILSEVDVNERRYGEWSMIRPARNPAVEGVEYRILTHLAELTSSLASVFRKVVLGAPSYEYGR